jgi:DNA-binding transcriptional LysR family regulator
MTSHLAELARVFDRLEMTLLRGTAPQIIDFLKAGDVELALAGDLGEGWDRVDRWPLFAEEFSLILNADHHLASHPTIEVDDLRHERWLSRAYCEDAAQTASLVRRYNLDAQQAHVLTSERDLLTLVEAGLGIAFVPRSASRDGTLKSVAVNGVELRRTVYLYGIAGRERTAVASAVLKLLRAADWSRYAS